MRIQTYSFVRLQRYALVYYDKIVNSETQTSSVNCSSGLNISPCKTFTCDANTTSAGDVESMQLALMEITACPPFLRKCCAFRATIRAWSGCATSAKITSTRGRSIRYFCGCRASSTIAENITKLEILATERQIERRTDDIGPLFCHVYQVTA